MSKNRKKVHKNHNSSDLAKQVSARLGLNPAYELQFYAELTQMPSGYVKDALDVMSRLDENTKVVDHAMIVEWASELLGLTQEESQELSEELLGLSNQYISGALTMLYDKTAKEQPGNAFEELPQYPIERSIFAEIFRELDEFACEGELPYEGPDFRFWDYDMEVYILHKPSGTLVNWYKLGHTGRCNTCNKKLTIDEYRKFASMALEEINEWAKKG